MRVVSGQAAGKIIQRTLETFYSRGTDQENKKQLLLYWTKALKNQPKDIGHYTV